MLLDVMRITATRVHLIRVGVKYQYLYLSTHLSVLDVLEYLMCENAKYLYLYLNYSTW